MTILTNDNDPIVVQGDQLVIDGYPQPYNQELVHAGTNIKDDSAKVHGRPQGGMYMPGAHVGNAVEISIYVRLYHRNVDGSNGPRISPNAHIKEYSKTLIADDTTWVDAATGTLLGKVGEEQVPENSQEPLYNEAGELVRTAGKFYGKTLIKEGQFFNGLRESAQVVNDVIAAYLSANKSRIQP